MARRGRKPNLTLRGSFLGELAQGPQTIATLSSEFNSNPVTAKNHLMALVSLGLVATGEIVKNTDPETGKATRGRPAQLFEITSEGSAALALDDTASALSLPEPVVTAPEAAEASETTEATTASETTEESPEAATEAAEATEVTGAATEAPSDDGDDDSDDDMVGSGYDSSEE